MLIVYPQPPGHFYQSVTYMAHLAAELFEAELLIVPEQKLSRYKRQLNILTPRFRGSESCLLICPGPEHLWSLYSVPGWKTRFGKLFGWVIDSFYFDRVTRGMDFCRQFDHLLVARKDDIEEWTRRLKTPTTWVPWGSDVLRLGSQQSERPWDVLRIGRQPDEWNDDSEVARDCEKMSLSFHGRFAVSEDGITGQRHLMGLCAQSKFQLAFSNIAHFSDYTHRTRAYITARWVDALSSGTVVAGIPPRCAEVDELFWPGATLDLGTVHRKEGLQIIADACQSWRPEHAQTNYLRSLERLDWRWRFAKIANLMNESPNKLRAEIDLLKRAIQAGSQRISEETFGAPNHTHHEQGFEQIPRT
jgi:hypothetical protein